MSFRRYLLRAAGLCAVAMFAVTFSGCDAPKPAQSKGDTHEHSHDEHLHTDNFAESVGTLRTLHDEIKKAFESGKPEDGHHALHDIGHVLEALEKTSGRCGC